MSPYDLEIGYNGAVSNVIPFPVTVDSLTRQLIAVDRENQRLRERISRLGTELEEMRAELIELLTREERGAP